MHAIRDLSRVFRKEKLKTRCYNRKVWIFFKGYSFYITPESDDYLRVVHFLVNGKMTYIYLPTGTYSVCKSLNKIGYLPLENFNNISKNFAYYRRTKSASYVGGVLMTYYKNRIHPSGHVMLTRSDGKVFNYSKKSFQVMYTQNPTYEIIPQLKLF